MLHFRLPTAALVAPLAALGITLGGGALAPAAAAEPAGIQLAQSQSFSDDQLQSFALAAIEIQEIRATYVTQIQEADSEEQRQQLSEEATEAMVQAVDETPGITVEDYNAIIEASADDPELSERINEYMQSATQ